MTKDEAEALREKRVAEKTQDLMRDGGEYYQFTIRNFTEALQNFSDASYITLASFAGASHKLYSNCAASSMLANSVVGLVVDYWRPLATDEAERTVPCVEEIMGDEL